MSKQTNIGIAVYPIDKWVNLWVEKVGTKEFSWRISTQAPEDALKITPAEITDLTESGLSSTAKGVFLFILQHRFSKSRVCLHGPLAIAKLYGCSNNTARRAVKELMDANIIGKLKIHTGKNVAYQYFIKDYGSWILPKNPRLESEIGAPSKILNFDS